MHHFFTLPLLAVRHRVTNDHDNYRAQDPSLVYLGSALFPSGLSIIDRLIRHRNDAFALRRNIQSERTMGPVYAYVAAP